MSTSVSRAALELSREETDDCCSPRADAVLNHKAGADESEPFMATEVDDNDRNKEVSGLVRLVLPTRLVSSSVELTSSPPQYEIEGWTKFTFPARGDKYSDFKWQHFHFTGTLARRSRSNPMLTLGSFARC